MTQHMRLLACLVLLAFFVAGCYRYTDIKPTEVPKLNNTFTKHLGSYQMGNTLIKYPGPYQMGSTTFSSRVVSVRTVEKSNGKLFQVEGPVSLVVRTANGSYTFEHPTEGKLTGGVLSIKSANRAKMAFQLTEIKKVQVKEFSYTANILMISVIALAATAAIVATEVWVME